jgi:hypothetical protein
MERLYGTIEVNFGGPSSNNKVKKVRDSGRQVLKLVKKEDGMLRRWEAGQQVEKQSRRLLNKEL